MTLRLNGSTSGYTEIDAPAVAGSNTLVLPTGNGSSGQFLQTNGSGTLSWAGGGKILQVVQALKTDTQSFAPSSSFSDVSSLSVSITPSSSSNKVLVYFSINGGNGGDLSHLHIQLVRGSTAIGLGDAAGNRTQNTGGYINTATPGQVLVNSMMVLDSPSTTSSTTYKLQAKCNSGGGTSWVNRSTRDNDGTGYDGRGSSVIVVMEVAA